MPPTPMIGIVPGSSCRNARDHLRRASGQRRAAQATGSSASGCPDTASRAIVVFVAIMPSSPIRRERRARASRSGLVQVRRDLHQQRHVPCRAPRRASPAPPSARHEPPRGLLRLQIAQALRVRRGNVDRDVVRHRDRPRAGRRGNHRPRARSACRNSSRCSRRRCRRRRVFAAAFDRGVDARIVEAHAVDDRLLLRPAGTSRGVGLPGWGRGVRVPTSTRPNPQREPRVHRGCRLVHARGETNDLGNRRPSTSI